MSKYHIGVCCRLCQHSGPVLAPRPYIRCYGDECQLRSTFHKANSFVGEQSDRLLIFLLPVLFLERFRIRISVDSCQPERNYSRHAELFCCRAKNFYWSVFLFYFLLTSNHTQGKRHNKALHFPRADNRTALQRSFIKKKKKNRQCHNFFLLFVI